MATKQTSTQRSAGVFDIRVIIAVLIGVYGLVLTIMGLAVTTDAEIEKSAGLNINLWAGIGMLVVAGMFVLWTLLRPQVTPNDLDDQAERASDDERI